MTVAGPPLIRVKRTREDKQQQTRRALFEAAIAVVGEEGYVEATVSKMTKRANIANGTFYNYFKSQQDIFDQLLPFVGERLIAHIKAQLDPKLTGASRDRARFVAYFDFCRRSPGFLRILNEAEVFAPNAYHRHVVMLYEGYSRSLLRSAKNGEIENFSEVELGPVVFMLMGIRSYMTMLYQYKYIDRSTISVDALADIYEKFVSGGLYANPSAAASEPAASDAKKRTVR
jgi:AcrR family transcriptional regulator